MDEFQYQVSYLLTHEQSTRQKSSHCPCAELFDRSVTAESSLLPLYHIFHMDFLIIVDVVVAERPELDKAKIYRRLFFCFFLVLSFFFVLLNFVL